MTGIFFYLFFLSPIGCTFKTLNIFFFALFWCLQETTYQHTFQGLHGASLGLIILCHNLKNKIQSHFHFAILQIIIIVI